MYITILFYIHNETPFVNKNVILLNLLHASHCS
jgi:hypothetical protein